MTEASENGYLVRVRAQVMCRDEATGGWVALGGGGLAHVMVGRRPRGDSPPSPQLEPDNKNGGDTGSATSIASPPHEYYIHGRRISDNQVVLECTIKKDFKYYKVMPTFHHWVTDERRFGLTFQTAADARAFDKGVRLAIEELLDGVGGAWPSLHAYPAPRDDDEEQRIFECLNLPCESRSSSEHSSSGRRPDQPILTAITLPQHHSHSDVQYEGRQEDDACAYVHLSAVHDYTYPSPGSERTSPHGKSLERDTGSLKKCSYSGPPPLPDKKPTETFQSRLKCRHCHSWYVESANGAGACEFAPDCCRECVDAVSCIKCAQCMLYHCMSDAEGDFAMHPCACGPPDHACAKRWVAVTLLSLVVPCLWCYLPLRAARKAARAARRARGMHSPVHEQARRK